MALAAIALAAMALAVTYGPGSMTLAANYICPGSCVEQASFNINFSLEQDELFEDSYNINGVTPNEQNHTDISDYQNYY